MALDFNGTTDNLTKASSEISGYPCTIAAWFNADSVAANQSIAAVHNNGTNNHFALAITTTSKVRAQARAGGTTVNADSTGTFSTGTWVHGVAVQTDATHHLPYINGTAGSNVATSVSPSGFSTTKVAAAVGALSAFDGRIAEVGMWNVVLDASEIAALASGFSPLLIRPSALFFYQPLITSGVINLVSVASPGVQSMTVTGTTASAHPRIFNPSRRTLRRFDVAPPSTSGAGTADGVATVAGVGAAIISAVGTVSVSATVRGVSGNSANQFDLVTASGNYTVPAGFNPLDNCIHVFTPGGDGSVGSTGNSGSGGSGGGGPGYARLDNVAWQAGDIVNLTLPAHGTASPVIVRNAAGNTLASIGGAANGTKRDIAGAAIAGGLGGGQTVDSSGYSVLFQGGQGGDSDNGFGGGGGGAASPQGNGKNGGDVAQAGSGYYGTGGGAVPGPLSTDGFNGNNAGSADPDGNPARGLGGTGPTGTRGGTITTTGTVDGGDGSNGSGGSGGRDTIHITSFTFPDDASGGGDGGYLTLWTINGTPVRVRAGGGGGGGHQNTDNGAQFGGAGGDGGGGGGGGGAGWNTGGVTPIAGAPGIGTDSIIVVEWAAAAAAADTVVASRKWHIGSTSGMSSTAKGYSR